MTQKTMPAHTTQSVASVMLCHEILHQSNVGVLWQHIISDACAVATSTASLTRFRMAQSKRMKLLGTTVDFRDYIILLKVFPLQCIFFVQIPINILFYGSYSFIGWLAGHHRKMYLLGNLFFPQLTGYLQQCQ